ncbi:hypothetical protein B7755_052155 [Streptomyces sp. NBS 14/10]|uniref:hypothetical protein n=1 Tax=Streptomyces sp. NBS 14/10 TaxID=1945643 RepID=UPI000B9D018C|nr:hypothetical protein [Streptomyces sp. NBS 14/10]KAK1176703.1 hypothetical protein B7755_052155 [Streptomyces sp. NBS 14/10]
MIEHFGEMLAAPPVGIQGPLLGSVGAGGVAVALTAGLIAGIREPKGGEGGKKGKIRKRLTSSQASVMGVSAGTFYMTAGSIWTAGEQVSDSLSRVITDGGFGTAGTGGVSALLAAVMYFREPRPGLAAVIGIVSAGVWASAGGIWGLPQALLLQIADALGAI